MTAKLVALQEHIAAACGIPNGDSHQRDVCDIVVAVGTRWLNRNRPRKNARDHELFHRHCLARSRKRARRCGIAAFLALEVLAFLLQKAMHALWNWYWQTPENQAACHAVAAGLKREVDDA